MNKINIHNISGMRNYVNNSDWRVVMTNYLYMYVCKVNSNEVVIQSKTNFVKVVQNQLLSRSCPIVRLRQPQALVAPAYIQYYMNIRLSKKICSHWIPTICQSLRKINQSEWQKCFDHWFKSMQKCIDLNGEYYEKQ